MKTLFFIYAVIAAIVFVVSFFLMIKDGIGWVVLKSKGYRITEKELDDVGFSWNIPMVWVFSCFTGLLSLVAISDDHSIGIRAVALGIFTILELIFIVISVKSFVKRQEFRRKF